MHHGFELVVGQQPTVDLGKIFGLPRTDFVKLFGDKHKR